MSQPRQDVALEEFFQWESEAWVEVVSDMKTDEKAHFVPLEIVKSYLKADNSKKLDKILCEVFDSKFPPIDPELILREHTAIFCILLRIGEGKYIEHFARYEELSDRRLPFDRNHPPAEFPSAEDDTTFLQRFCDKQQMYCVPIFDDHMLHKHFGRLRLLPITHKVPLGIDGLGDRYGITVYGPHNRLRPAGSDKTTNNPNANTFVLKMFSTKVGEGLYTQEVNGFRSVKHADSIIKFYGSYIHGDASNILLEYADMGTLEEYFKKESPPSRGVDIIKFWESLFQLTKGLKAIHSVREAHYDVKPENIFVLSNGAESPSDWQFKFADFGLMNPRAVPQSGDAVPNETKTTPTYGPPECYIPFEQTKPSSPKKISWSADIWSLGCIYSEAAMWIADGYKGVLDYRRQRMANTEQVLFKGADCFHDGTRVLQAVLDNHRDIEDRLRRADYITKDVLDSMVDEMLWEEDRPNAKALWRKAEMLSSRARQRMSVNSGDELFRPGSSQNRSLSLGSRPPPPTQPLPPIPRGITTGLASISERQHPLNVEKWRAQVPVAQMRRSQFSEPANDMPSPSLVNAQLRRSQFSEPGSEMQSPSVLNAPISSTESVSELGRELTNSIASWQLGDNNSTASPITPFTSPRASTAYTNVTNDDYRNISNFPNLPSDVRPRYINNASYENRRSAKPMFQTSPYPSNTEAPEVPQLAPRSSVRESIANIANTLQVRSMPSPEGLPHDRSDSPTMDTPPVVPGGAWRVENQSHTVETAPQIRKNSSADQITLQQMINRSPSRAGSRSSDAYSLSNYGEELHPPPKSQKRRLGFSLFPSNSRKDPRHEPHRAVDTPPPSVTRKESLQSVPRTMSISSHSTSTNTYNIEPDIAIAFDYLSINTAMEWKKAHKKVKKGTLPPLPGANRLEGLKDRDHIFIIDDSASMSKVWPDLKRVFETLSYVVKGMSPDGTEMFYTVSYDTYQRKDTTDLCEFLEKKVPNGVTNISYRLNLQLQAYRLKMFNAKKAKGKKSIVRPMSIYILTNGEWGPGADPKIAIQDLATYLKTNNVHKGQVTIEFISFAQTAVAMQKINDVAKADFGLDIVDTTRWTGNVLKMLRGPLDKTLYEEPTGDGDRPVASPTPSSGTMFMVAGSVTSQISELA